MSGNRGEATDEGGERKLMLVCDKCRQPIRRYVEMRLAAKAGVKLKVCRARIFIYGNEEVYLCDKCRREFEKWLGLQLLEEEK